MKRWQKWVLVVICFLLAFPCHFMYEWFPNRLTAIFFPINESIFEHMKILVTSFLLANLFSYYWLKNKNNILLSCFVCSFLIIPLYLVFYLPIYHLFGEIIVYSIGLIFVVDIIIFYLHFWLLKQEDLNLKWVGLVGIIVLYLILVYFSYHPILNNLFLTQ